MVLNIIRAAMLIIRSFTVLYSWKVTDLINESQRLSCVQLFIGNYMLRYRNGVGVNTNNITNLMRGFLHLV